MFSPYTSRTRKVLTPRNEASMEAMVEQARTTRHPWLIDSGASMSPEDFENGFKADTRSSRRQEMASHPACPRVFMASWLRKRMITSLQVAVSRVRSEIWKWWKICDQDHTRQSLLWCKEKTKNSRYAANKNALSASGLQWWKVARKKQGRRR